MEEQNMRFKWLKNIGRLLLILGILSFIATIFLIAIGIKENMDNLISIYGTTLISWGITAIISGGILECLAFIEDNTHRTVALLAKLYNTDKQTPVEN